MTRRIAVVGIDGCGKSTVLGRFLDLFPGARSEIAAMTCPQYHRTPDAPLARLSRELDDFSRAADALGCFELKATALYLQMTLYGAVERFSVETYRPRFLLSERHALVDSLAYGPFYVQMLRKGPDRSRFETPLREKLGDAWDSVLRWQEIQSRRLGRDLGIWDLALFVREIFRRPFGETVEALGREYGTALPDVLILLDVDAKTAVARLSSRTESELHETEAVLEQLRRSYHRAVEQLRVGYPEVEVHVIGGHAVPRGAGVDEILSLVLERAGISAAV